ncbi:hypothetical protein PTKIN_Ptkin18bG0048000 [Pterospermum kingtungense]
MVGKKLPSANIKAKPHVESMIKTLKKDWSIIFDMVQDKAIGQDAQAAADILEDIALEENVEINEGDKLSEITDKLSDSIGSERILQQKVQELYGALGEIEGLAADEMYIALSKIPDHPSQMLVFFSLPPN